MKNGQKKLTFIDLFAGVGGFSQGFLRVNDATLPFDFTPKLLVDTDQTAGGTFKKNFPYIPFWVQDLYKVEGEQILGLTKMKRGELDFLIGGPPCQGFSTNGFLIPPHQQKILVQFSRQSLHQSGDAFCSLHS